MISSFRSTIGRVNRWWIYICTYIHIYIYMKFWSSQHRCLVLMMLQGSAYFHDYSVIWHIYLPMAVSQRIFVELQISDLYDLEDVVCQVNEALDSSGIETLQAWNVKREGCDQKFHHSNNFWGLTCVLSWNACHVSPIVSHRFFFQFQMTWKLVVFESFSNFAGFNSQMFDQIPPICWVIDFIEKKRKDLDVFTLHGWCGYLEIFTKTLKPCVFVCQGVLNTPI